MSAAPYPGATPEELAHPLVNHFLAIHATFRQQLADLLRLSSEILAGELPLPAPEMNARLQRLIHLGARYTYGLHLHHRLETQEMFPTLAAEGLETDVIERLNAEHRQLSDLLDQVNAGIQDLDTAAPGALDARLLRLSQQLKAHLDYEEVHV
ncbi:MAG: hemerythrin domain-containing protein, partial [Chloroflexi bacterium]|nr:hemerythrin domain-containing protein [Chloroflexota bacterium]